MHHQATLAEGVQLGVKLRTAREAPPPNAHHQCPTGFESAALTCPARPRRTSNVGTRRRLAPFGSLRLQRSADPLLSPLLAGHRTRPLVHHGRLGATETHRAGASSADVGARQPFRARSASPSGTGR